MTAAAKVRLIYVSRATPRLTYDALDQIIAVSERENARLGITGVLVRHGERFLQALEGPEADVLDLYHRIEQDPRHTSCVLLGIEPIARRAFGDWSMRLLSATGENTRRLQQFFAALAASTPGDSADAACALLGDLSARAVTAQ